MAGAMPAVFSRPPMPSPSYVAPPQPQSSAGDVPSPKGDHALPGAVRSSHSHRRAVANNAWHDAEKEEKEEKAGG
jgi:hypothetical protein